ncbi:MAG: glycosyl transferase family 2 [Acidobacteria bacterium]|nr:glycosyl transferase family 2 [Acidobacteriota bacterium]
MPETPDVKDSVEQTGHEAEGELERNLERLSGADLVLGIPSYNNAATIATVIAAAQAGVARYFPDSRVVIVHADGGSSDGTAECAVEAADREKFLQVPFRIYPVDKHSGEHTLMPGKASAQQAIFQLASKLGAKASVVVNGWARGVTPEWVEQLARPVLEQGFDFVAPYYRRHKFDGAIGKGILDPMVRVLFGRRIRQAGSAEFAASARLVERCLLKKEWTTDISSISADFWLSIQALSGGFRVCQAYLGPKVEDAEGPLPDLSAILSHLLGCLFSDMVVNPAYWQKLRGSEPVPVFGPPFESATEPASVNILRMIESYRLGHRDLQGIWGMVLPPATMLELKKLAMRPDEAFRIEDEVWARTVSDFSLAYRLRNIGRDHLLRALTPLYLGWAASFILQIEDAGPEAVERRVEKLCLAYEAQKPYLISRWRWPDRFNP